MHGDSSVLSRQQLIPYSGRDTETKWSYEQRQTSKLTRFTPSSPPIGGRTGDTLLDWSGL